MDVTLVGSAVREHVLKSTAWSDLLLAEHRVVCGCWGLLCRRAELLGWAAVTTAWLVSTHHGAERAGLRYPLTSQMPPLGPPVGIPSLTQSTRSPGHPPAHHPSPSPSQRHRWLSSCTATAVTVLPLLPVYHPTHPSPPLGSCPGPPPSSVTSPRGQSEPGWPGQCKGLLCSSLVPGLSSAQPGWSYCLAQKPLTELPTFLLHDPGQPGGL